MNMNPYYKNLPRHFNSAPAQIYLAGPNLPLGICLVCPLASPALVVCTQSLYRGLWVRVRETGDPIGNQL